MTTTDIPMLDEGRLRAAPEPRRTDPRRSTTKFLRAAAGAIALAAALTGVSASPAAADVRASTPIQYVTNYFWSGSTNVITTGTVSCPTGSRVVPSGASVPGGNGALTGISPVLPDYTAVTATGYTQLSAGHDRLRTHRRLVRSDLANSRTARRDDGLPTWGGLLPGRDAGVRWRRDHHRAVRACLRRQRWRWCPTRSARMAPAGRSPRPSASLSDHLLVTTQCAPFRGGGFVAANAAPSDFTKGNVYASCPPNYTALSGGVYLSRPDGSEVRSGLVDYSIVASNNRWYASGTSYESRGANTVVALAQCIIY